EPAWVGEHDVGELAPIDLRVLTEHLGAELLHDRAVPGGAAALLVARDRIRVEHPGAKLAQHRRDRALARADRAGEADDEGAHGPSCGSTDADHSSYSCFSARSSSACSEPRRRVSMKSPERAMSSSFFASCESCSSIAAMRAS